MSDVERICRKCGKPIPDGFWAGIKMARREFEYEHLQCPPPCPACEAAAQERDDLHSLCDRQSGILSRVAVALRGPEPPLTRWSHHDLPERAERAIQERDAAYEDARLMQARLQRLIDAEPQRELVTNYKHMYEVETETAQRYYRELADLRARLEAECEVWEQQATILENKGNPIALGLKRCAGDIRALLRKEATK